MSDLREINMVRIEAIIRPSRFNDVKLALDDLGVTGISVIEIKGAGSQKGFTQHYRGSEYHRFII
jgi:nitrogen regulatory protein P-II 1